VDWAAEQAARADFPWFEKGADGENRNSPWIETPESRAADAATIRRLVGARMSPEQAVAELDAVRDRERFERAVELGVNEEDAEAAIEGQRLLREARRARDARRAETGGFIAESYDRTLEAASQPAEEQPDAPAQPEDAEQLRIRPPQVWVGSLSDYNDGSLHGAWMDAAREVEAIQADIQTMLDASPLAAQTGQPAEEWGIFDHEGFGAFRLAEYENLEVVSRIARGIAEHGLAYAAYAEVMDGDPDALAGFTDAYLGHHDSIQAYAEQLVDELGYADLFNQAVPSSLQQYVRINTEALARDLELGGAIHVLPAAVGGVWIFRSDT
jgi:antirestriction protein